MKRMEVLHMAKRLSDVSGVNTESIYDWLMSVGHDKKKNPRLLDVRAVPGMVYLNGESDGYRIEIFPKPANRTEPCNGSDYENLILARQERWVD